MHAVVLLQPALPGERLSVASQVNEVFLFDTYADANAWIDLFQERQKEEHLRSLTSKFEFLICEVSDPSFIGKRATELGEPVDVPAWNPPNVRRKG